MKQMTVIAALSLALAGAACSQEKTDTVADVAPEATPASATTDDVGDFNLMIPGGDDAADDGYDGFNLSIPGDTVGNDILLPENARGDTIFTDVPDIGVPDIPETAPVDDVVRLDPAD